MSSCSTVLVCALVVGFCLTGCEKPIELDGLVTSKLDGTPVRGVTIVRLGTAELQLGTTGTDGCFAFKNVFERSGRAVPVQFSALGYAPARVTIPFGDERRVRVVLSPEMLGGPSEATLDAPASNEPLPCAHAGGQ